MQLGMQEEVAVALDVGGTWTRTAVVNESGNVLWRNREATLKGQGTDALVEQLRQSVRQGCEAAAPAGIHGIALGMAGPLDPQTGVLFAPPNLMEMDGVSLTDMWGDSMGAPVLVGNDATLAALGEYHYGAGRGCHTLVYITLSTGIGGGIVVDGQLFQGASGFAGEIGHTRVESNGPECGCGSRGCLEAVASGTGIARQARTRIARGEASLLAAEVSPIEAIDTVHVFDAAARQDRLAQDIVNKAARGLGVGLLNVLQLLDPDLIVLGGSVSQQWPVLAPVVEAHVAEHAMNSHFRESFKVVVSPLGDDVVMLGAAALVWDTISPLSAYP